MLQIMYGGLRLVDLTEKCPSQRGEQFKAPCQCSGWMEMPVNNQTKIADKRKLTITLDSTTKLARTAPTWGIETGALNR